MTSARRFPRTPESVSAARRFARDAAGELPCAALDAVELMVSELASNCIEHANTPFELAIEVSEDEVRVSARDSGRGRPVPRSPKLSEPRGRGLRIVEALADDWGIVASVSQSTVWFSLCLQPSAGASEPRGGGAHRRSPTPA